MTWQKQRNGKNNISGLSKNPKFDNARRLRGIYFIDPADAEFEENSEKYAEKVGSSDARSNALQDQGRKYKETGRTPDAQKTKYACIVETDEPTRKRMEGTLHKDHKDHIAGKGINSLNHFKSPAPIYSSA